MEVRTLKKVDCCIHVDSWMNSDGCFCSAEKTRLTATVSPNFVSIDTYLEDQQLQCQHAAKAFEQIVDKLQALVEKVCKDVTTRARVNEDAPISTVRDTAADGESGKGRAPPAKHRSKSMSQVKEEHSQRVAARLKLDVAASVAGRTFYFPHNLDFRGRAYAVGPHLQYLGDDLARGLLTFAKRKPLGERGLYWLKVQLANLYGMDKLSLDGRVAWADEQIASGDVAEVDESPINQAALEWWTKAENPLQALALTFEVSGVLRSATPSAPK